jgi:hypothetical protein
MKARRACCKGAFGRLPANQPGEERRIGQTTAAIQHPRARGAESDRLSDSEKNPKPRIPKSPVTSPQVPSNQSPVQIQIPFIPRPSIPQPSPAFSPIHSHKPYGSPILTTRHISDNKNLRNESHRLQSQTRNHCAHWNWLGSINPRFSRRFCSTSDAIVRVREGERQGRRPRGSNRRSASGADRALAWKQNRCGAGSQYDRGRTVEPGKQ